MRNRAKCTLCGDIVESFALHDIVSCSCDEITISGGNQKYLCWAKNEFKNFRRIGLNDEEIVVQQEKKQGDFNDNQHPLNSDHTDVHSAGVHSDVGVSDQVLSNSSHQVDDRVKMLEDLDIFLNYFKNLPEQALLSPVTHYDLQTVLLLLRRFFVTIAAEKSASSTC